MSNLLASSVLHLPYHRVKGHVFDVVSLQVAFIVRFIWNTVDAF